MTLTPFPPAVEFYGARLPLVQQGDQWYGPCLYHTETFQDRTFTFNIETGAFLCMACHRQGPMEQFAEDYASIFEAMLSRLRVHERAAS